MIFNLVQDFAELLDDMLGGAPRRTLTSLNEAVRRYVQFIDRQFHNADTVPVEYVLVVRLSRNREASGARETRARTLSTSRHLLKLTPARSAGGS